MKNILIVFLTILSVTAVAQIDRSKAPEPGPAPEIKLGKYEQFTLDNGLKVFVVENHKLPRIQFSLILAHEAVKEGDKAGYINLAGQLLRNGTSNRTKAELDQEVDFIGASLSTSSSGVYASSLTKHTDKLLELMTDVLYNPTFPKEEFEKLKKQTLSGLAMGKEDPNTIAGNVSKVLTYGKDHPYGELVTEETLENVTLEDMRNYYEKYYIPNNAYLAIVGDINVDKAKELTSKYFSKWKKGSVENKDFNTPTQPEETFIAMVDRPSSVQSVVSISYPINLKPGDSKLEAARVMNQILGGGFSSRLTQNLREDKAFTYGAGSSISEDKLVGRFRASASVRNEVTDSALNEFMYELKRIRENEVSDEELAAAKAYMTGSFARSLESPATIARFAVNMERYNLPADYYQNYLKRINAITKEDVMNAAKEFIRPENAYITLVGKAEDVKDKLSPFGKIKYYDMYGSPEKEMADASELPSAEQILKNYVNAIGGQEKLENVNSIVVNSAAEMQGMVFNITNISKLPGRAVNAVSVNGMVMQEVIYNQGKAKMMMQGNEVPVNQQVLDEMKYNTAIFPELSYENMDIKTEVKGIKNVSGQEAYMVQITFPTGTVKTEYFSVESGLKLKTEGATSGSIEYADYKEVDGILFPHTMKLNTPQGPMNAMVTEIKINSDLSDEKFKVE